MPYLSLVRRDNTGDSANASPFSSSSPNAPVYIAGIVVCALIVAGLATWLVLRHIRRRNQEKLEENRGAAFLTVRGLVKVQDGSGDSYSPNPAGVVNGVAFSKTEYENVVMPDKYLKPPPSRNEIIAAHRQSGNYPKPFAFALNASHSPSSSIDQSARSSIAFNDPRMSFISVTSQHNNNRFSVMSTASSIKSGLTTGQSRKVRQQSDPVLPDELLVSKGERVTIMESFDDGWCLVGRENSLFASISAKSLFGSKKPEAESNIELGVVPAWCFAAPAKDLRAERPVRSSSLGITVQLESPAAGRNDIISWSNF